MPGFRRVAVRKIFLLEGLAFPQTRLSADKFAQIEDTQMHPDVISKIS
jgi:hypothetical protein